MARAHLDANIPYPVWLDLRGRGHDVTHSRASRELYRAPDGKEVLYAAQDERIIVSHNLKDFRLLHDAWRRWSDAWEVDRRHAGMLLSLPSLDFARLAEAIDKQLEHTEANQLYELDARWRWDLMPWNP